MTPWDTRFLRLAQEVATWSKDPNKKVGAVIVTADKRAFSAGYNGFPRGCADEHMYASMPVEIKNAFTCHAEANAIDNAPFELEGTTLYTTKPPCLECAKRIVQSRIKRVVTPPLETESKWYETQLFGRDLLVVLNVELEVYGEGGIEADHGSVS